MSMRDRAIPDFSFLIQEPDDEHRREGLNEMPLHPQYQTTTYN